MIISYRYGHYRDRKFDSRDRQIFAKFQIFKIFLIFARTYIPNNLENTAEMSSYLVSSFCLLLFVNVIDHLSAKGNILTISHSHFAATLSPFMAVIYIYNILFPNNLFGRRVADFVLSSFPS